MARRALHGDPTLPPRGAEVVARIVPRGAFTWVIRTGTQVDRPALAVALTQINTGRAYQVARQMLLDRNLPQAVTTTLVRQLTRAARTALTYGYAYHGNDVPKGEPRIVTEAVVMHAILKVAAALLTATAAVRQQAQENN